MNQADRLFIGISFAEKKIPELDEAMRVLAKGIREREVEARWTPVENRHITLVFLGEIPATKRPQLIEILRNVVDQHFRFKLKLTGISGFPSEMKARVLYAGVQAKRDLRTLQSNLTHALASHGFIVESEFEYSPHLTLVRLRNPRSVKDLISPIKGRAFGRWEVSEVTLFRSVRAGNYSMYEPLVKLPLKEALTSEES